MIYVGDFTEDSVFDFKFNTKSLAQVPATLSGSPAVKCYKDNATGTETATGLTLTVDFDSLTGLNNVRVDSSADAFYATGSDYFVVVTTGTVDSISAIGQVVAHFSIENRSTDYLKTQIGLDGAGLTDLGGMSTGMKAEVNAEADTALTDYDSPTKTEMDSAFTEIKGATWASGTDTLEHIRNKQTDIETDTAEIGTAGAGLTDLGGMSTGMKAEVQSECADAITAAEPIDANITQWAGAATIDTLTLAEWAEFILAALAGDVARSGDTYAYKKQNGSTTAFSYTVTAGGRS